MSIFDKINEAKVSQPRDYVRPGRYLLRVDGLKTGKTRKKLDFFVTNFTVLHVIDATAAVNDTRGASKVGDKPGWMIMVHWDSFLGTVRGLLSVLAGEKIPDEEIQEIAELAVGNEQPFAGKFLEINAHNKVDEDDPKKVFTVVDPVRVWEMDEVKAAVSEATLKSLGVIG